MKTCQQLYGVEPIEFMNLKYCDAINLKKELVFKKLSNIGVKMNELLEDGSAKSYEEYLKLNITLCTLEKADKHCEMLINEMEGFAI